MSKSKMSKEVFESLSDYGRKHYSNELKFGDYYVVFEKPAIETRFCFGFDEIGNSPSVKESCDCAHNARTNSDYLIEYNLKKLEDLKNEYENNEMVVLCSHGKIGYLRCKELIERGYYNADYVVHELDADDKKRLLNVINEEIAKFEKRLNTYVKRYGTSCVRAWTYSVND